MRSPTPLTAISSDASPCFCRWRRRCRPTSSRPPRATAVRRPCAFRVFRDGAWPRSSRCKQGQPPRRTYLYNILIAVDDAADGYFPQVARYVRTDLDSVHECPLDAKPQDPPLGHAAAARLGVPHAGAARLHAGHGRGSCTDHADVPWRRAAAARRAITRRGRWADAGQPHTARGSLCVCGRRHGCATADHAADPGRSGDARCRSVAA